MIETKRLTLTQKEAEAVLWGVAQIGDRPNRKTEGDSDPLYILLDSGYTRREIVQACKEIEVVCYRRFVDEPLDPIEQDILRLCVENTSWIDAYRRNEPTRNSPAHIEEALATLRGLAAKLEDFDIEVSHIPFD